VRLAAVLALVALGCDSAPGNPTWTEDVKPILQANCSRCHGAVPRSGAPAQRFDLYPDEGAASFALARIEAEEMPPTVRLSDVQMETIANWVDDGTPLGEPTGGRPSFELIEPVAVDPDGVLTFEYLITDPDFDVVSGFVFATIDGADEVRLPDLTSGRFVYQVETGAAPGAVIILRAAMTDGDQRVDAVQGEITGGVPVELGAITVPSAATGGLE
jgi:hypothetical protein